VLDVARRGYRTVGTIRSPEKSDVVTAAAREAEVEVEAGSST